jgi:hypothetical protein
MHVDWWNLSIFTSGMLRTMFSLYENACLGTMLKGKSEDACFNSRNVCMKMHVLFLEMLYLCLTCQYDVCMY